MIEGKRYFLAKINHTYTRNSVYNISILDIVQRELMITVRGGLSVMPSLLLSSYNRGPIKLKSLVNDMTSQHLECFLKPKSAYILLLIFDMQRILMCYI